MAFRRYFLTTFKLEPSSLGGGRLQMPGTRRQVVSGSKVRGWVVGSRGQGLDTCFSNGLASVPVLQPPEDQIAFFSSLICTGARQNPATCGTRDGNRTSRSNRTSQSGRELEVQGLGPTSPHSAIESTSSTALICTTHRWILASASTNQETEKGDSIIL